MTRFSQAKGRKVVSLDDASTVGRVNEFVVEPSTVLALRLKKTGRKADVLRWSDIHAFGADAVTVDTGDKVTEPSDDVAARSDRAHRVLGKRVLSVAGDELGEVDDVEFDESSGSVTAVVLKDGTVVTCRLVGIGSYAVVAELAADDAE